MDPLKRGALMPLRRTSPVGLSMSLPSPPSLKYTTLVGKMSAFATKRNFNTVSAIGSDGSNSRVDYVMYFRVPIFGDDFIPSFLMKAPTPSMAKIPSFLVNFSGAWHPEDRGTETFVSLDVFTVSCVATMSESVWSPERQIPTLPKRYASGPTIGISTCGHSTPWRWNLIAFPW